MPCYTQSEIRINEEEFKARADIMKSALPTLRKELKAFYGEYNAYVLMDDRGMTLSVAGNEINLDFTTGKLTYPQNLIIAKNMLKRNYSAAVVKAVSLQSRVKSKFNLKQTAEREYRLERRR
ncbi:MAG: hypothetical protein AB9866_21525 [Syntrophobacteraceae bacterium]